MNSQNLICVLRGGGWNFNPRCVRSADRGRVSTLNSSNLTGVRIVLKEVK
jgi:formylglycine-generating enzyme required for sulfatase activity